jgi:hypothetical protein
VPSAAVPRLGSLDPESAWLVPLVVAVAVEGKKEALVPPTLYEVAYIFLLVADVTWLPYAEEF